jgi:hypothetical protein
MTARFFIDVFGLIKKNVRKEKELKVP